MKSDPFTADIDAELTQAIRAWADRHPKPDRPFLYQLDGSVRSPKEIAREVEQRTEFGKLQLEVLRDFASQHLDLRIADLVTWITQGKSPYRKNHRAQHG
jgi:hypothetical protein